MKCWNETAGVAKAVGKRRIFKLITFSHGAALAMT